MARLAGRYELQQRLAEGGMAEVWLAVAHGDAGFTRRVAIKQLFPREDEGGAFARMFLDEARITSRLHHAGIVAILDYGIEAGRPFQVLELVDGFDAARLAQWGRAQGKPLPVGLALHVCAMVGYALHFAHVAIDDTGAALNIVHRDVSPQNVLLSRAGDVKLSDFGVAFAEGRLEKTVGGAARGKPAYMAPEQAVRGPMDGRTDVFSLGCVLHALLTGESALKDENALVDLLAGLELELASTLPVEVKELIAKAVRRNKAERWDTAEAFALACAQLAPKFLEAEPRTALAEWVRSVAPERVTQLSTPSNAPAARPRPWGLMFGALGLVVVAGAAVGSLARPSEATALDAGAREAVRVAAPPMPEVVDAGAPTSVAPVEGVVAKSKSPPRAVAAKLLVDAGVPARAPSLGVLTVGGERFLRAEVLIDGAARGFAPTRLELPTGSHRVEVVLRSGERVSREVVVSPQHTQSAPLSWEE